MPKPKTIKIFLEKLMNTSEHKQRSRIRKAILSYGKNAVLPLIKTTRHEDESIRWESVNLLGQIQDSRSIRSIVRAATTDEDRHTKWRAVWALSQFNRDVVITKLRKNLKNPKTRWNAAVALAVFNFPDAGPILLEGLKSDDEWVQWEALNGIKTIATRGVENKLAGFLNLKYSTNLRQEAVLALGSFKTRRAIAYLKRSLNDPEPGVRWRASMALAKSESILGKRAIQSAIKKEQDHKVKEQLRADLAYLEGVEFGRG